MKGYSHSYPWQILTRREGLLLTHRFDTHYDITSMERELRDVLQHYEVVPHYRPYLANGWGAITLYGPNGDPNEHRPAEAIRQKNVEHRRTPVMDLAPTIEGLVEAFPGKKRRVRLMRLSAGKRIYWHHDGDLFGLDLKCVRLHIPIITNPNVRMQVSHDDCTWAAGTLWFLDNSFPHRLHNAGSEDRVHLVLDLEVDDTVRAMFPDAMHEQRALRRECRRRCRRMFDLSMGYVFRFKKKMAARKEHAAA